MSNNLSSLLNNKTFGPHPKAPKINKNDIISNMEKYSPATKIIIDNLKSSGNEFSIADIRDALRDADGTLSRRDNIEKVINKNNLTDIAWLETGLQIKQAICRVVTPSGMGTGFLINGDYLITNNHVIDSKESAEETIVEFNYEIGRDKRQKEVSSFKLDTSRFKTNPDLDYTVVRVSGSPSATFGSIDSRSRATVKKGEHVVIIQHPSGGHKKIALTDNQVYEVFSQLVQYVTDTEPGSSGAPVFDQKWRLVALHHAGGNLPGPNGRTSFVNEGISIEYVINDASEVLGVGDEIFESVMTTIRPTLEWFCTTSGSKSDIQNAATQLSLYGAGFSRILESRLQPQQELGPLGAVILGTAAGAVIRHIGKQNESTQSDSKTIGVDESALQILKDAISATSVNMVPWTVYSTVVETCSKVPEKLKSVLDHGSKLEALPVVVGAFLAGVYAGSKAYDGKL